LSLEELLYRLVATEPEGLFAPKRVQLLKKARVGNRDDFFWGEASEPFEAGKYGNNPETSVILLATRHFGYSLTDLDQLPLDVYICGVQNPDLEFKAKLRQEDVSIMAWALLLSPDDERTSLEEIYESITESRGNVNYVNPVHQ
jgi:hypothetical protein